jgi:NAD(P)-dependent dehydrogenase (short-subunit alcohol dehydrogenase family)
MPLAGKSALITGSLGGIGVAAAKALAKQGCNITRCGFATPETSKPAWLNGAPLACVPATTRRTCPNPGKSPA